MCFTGKKIRAKFSKDGHLEHAWLKVEIIVVKDSMVVISTGASIFQVDVSKVRRPLWIWCEQHIPPDAHNTHILLVSMSHCTHAHFAWLKS